MQARILGIPMQRLRHCTMGSGLIARDCGQFLLEPYGKPDFACGCFEAWFPRHVSIDGLSPTSDAYPGGYPGRHTYPVAAGKSWLISLLPSSTPGEVPTLAAA
eukprot:894854-Rhodomonas_salina.2